MPATLTTLVPGRHMRVFYMLGSDFPTNVDVAEAVSVDSYIDLLNKDDVPAQISSPEADYGGGLQSPYNPRATPQTPSQKTSARVLSEDFSSGLDDSWIN